MDVAMIARNAIDRIIELQKQEDKPFVWYHPVSGRFRFDGDKLPASWIPLYK